MKTQVSLWSVLLLTLAFSSGLAQAKSQDRLQLAYEVSECPGDKGEACLCKRFRNGSVVRECSGGNVAVRQRPPFDCPAENKFCHELLTVISPGAIGATTKPGECRPDEGPICFGPTGEAVSGLTRPGECMVGEALCNRDGESVDRITREGPYLTDSESAL